MTISKSMKGGTFNVLFGRNHHKVQQEVIQLLAKHRLDFLCIQEGENYNDVLSKIPGYTLVSNPETWEGRESVILVNNTHVIDRINSFTYGDGWFTVKGKRHAPAGQSQVRIAGWLIVRSLHLPTPSNWRNGELESPVERKDDLIESMQGLKTFFSFPCVLNARLAAGDWNEPLTTIGKYSPAWLLSTTGATARAPESRLGHGRIDYPVAKGVEIVECFKDLNIQEGSDHEPVIFFLTRISPAVMMRRHARRLRRLRLRRRG